LLFDGAVGVADDAEFELSFVQGLQAVHRARDVLAPQVDRRPGPESAHFVDDIGHGLHAE
jgi:hypothetical protein